MSTISLGRRTGVSLVPTKTPTLDPILDHHSGPSQLLPEFHRRDSQGTTSSRSSPATGPVPRTGRLAHVTGLAVAKIMGLYNDLEPLRKTMHRGMLPGRSFPTWPRVDTSSATLRIHALSQRRVTPLPQWKANPKTDFEVFFQKEQLLLALYPQTTCFYCTLIHAPPQRLKRIQWRDHRLGEGVLAWGSLSSPSRLPAPQPQDDYSVLFEDTSYADGYSPPLNVAQRYVVACKEPKKK
ncbi:hypothetical protein P7K49_023260 [Saguinus oedipus]|uniref:SGF29 C-terminal domain-containing protein n=1 Tax=Saguinus oedipus TaxID=9490 RepID=A0ABQ9ULY7_SAGOE|nr:hypothetical protein P7K49_023260 [Saguinus oedipus]